MPGLLSLSDFLLSSHMLITQWWKFNFILKHYSNKCSPKRKICIYQESMEIIIQKHISRIRIRKCISLLWRIQSQGRRQKETEQPLPSNRCWKNNERTKMWMLRPISYIPFSMWDFSKHKKKRNKTLLTTSSSPRNTFQLLKKALKLWGACWQPSQPDHHLTTCFSSYLIYP